MVGKLQLYSVQSSGVGEGPMEQWLVASSSPREALELVLQGGRVALTDRDLVVRILVVAEAYPGQEEDSRILDQISDDETYRDQGWAEDGDEDGPTSIPCDTCGLHPWSSVQFSEVCSWCGMCAGCAIEQDPDEGSCPECENPGGPRG